MMEDVDPTAPMIASATQKADGVAGLLVTHFKLGLFLINPLASENQTREKWSLHFLWARGKF